MTITGPAGATIRYTTDGNEPTASSPVYSAPLVLSAATSLRAAAFADGAESSPVQTATYVIDAAKAAAYATRRAVMVTMPPADFARFSARDDALESRSAFQMITGGTTSVFALDAEGSVAGQFGSVDSPQVSMNVSARDAFGTKTIAASLWPEKPGITATKSFRLRNGSNDWAAAHLRDQFTQSAAAAGPNLYGSSSSVAMFVNGQYYALMDLRERENEKLVGDNLGVDKDLVDDLYDPLLPAQEIKNGGQAALDAYRAVHTFITTTDMSVPANYARATTLINPTSLAWDWALHHYTGNNDWPHRNVHVWRSPETDGRWNWAAHDMDFSFGRYSTASLDMTGRYTAQGSEMFAALMKSPTFRALYLNILADQLNLLTPAQLDARLDVMAAEMRPYIADYYARNNLGTEADWNSRLAEIRTYIAARPAVHDSQTRTVFGLGARAPISVTVNDRSMGSVTVNSIKLDPVLSPTSPVWSGSYYPGVPVSLQAQPKPGYAFVGWQGASTATASSITHTPVAGSSTAAFTAVFAAVAAPQAPVVPAIGTQSSVTGQTVRLAVAATDPTGYPLTYAAAKLPKGVSINAATGTIYGKITTPGAYASTVTVTNGATAAGAAVKTTVAFTWTVTDRPGTGALGTSPDAGPGIGDVDPYPSVDPVADRLTNLAQGKAATQSSTDFSGVAGRAVDGNTDGVFSNGSVTHTVSSSQPWCRPTSARRRRSVRWSCSTAPTAAPTGSPERPCSCRRPT